MTDPMDYMGNLWAFSEVPRDYSLETVAVTFSETFRFIGPVIRNFICFSGTTPGHVRPKENNSFEGSPPRGISSESFQKLSLGKTSAPAKAKPQFTNRKRPYFSGSASERRFRLLFRLAPDAEKSKVRGFSRPHEDGVIGNNVNITWPPPPPPPQKVVLPYRSCITATSPNRVRKAFLKVSQRFPFSQKIVFHVKKKIRSFILPFQLEVIRRGQ